MAFRLSSSRYRIKELLDIMIDANISKTEKIDQLKQELADHFNDPGFLKATTMGHIVKMQLKQVQRKSLIYIPKNKSRVSD